ncbi:MAG: hypothetical protein SFZ24_10750 [Planctomycetota bacterium]|nr:hypothetical protein [Planctomycetota bacterium]
MTLLHQPARWTSTDAPALLPLGLGDSPLVSRVHRRLDAHRVAERWLVERDDTALAGILYAIDRRRVVGERSAVVRAVHRIARLRGAHILPIDRVELDDSDALWLLGPYPGTYDGLFTLSRLLTMKADGQFSGREAHRAALHMLEGISCAHESGISHGAPRIDEVLVDRCGKIEFELFGIDLALRGECVCDEAARRADVRAVAGIVYELVTGAPPGNPVLDASELAGRRARSWEPWFERAIDNAGGGFDDAAAALAALPDARRLG